MNDEQIKSLGLAEYAGLPIKNFEWDEGEFHRHIIRIQSDFVSCGFEVGDDNKALYDPRYMGLAWLVINKASQDQTKINDYHTIGDAVEHAFYGFEAIKYSPTQVLYFILDRIIELIERDE